MTSTAGIFLQYLLFHLALSAWFEQTVDQMFHRLASRPLLPLVAVQSEEETCSGLTAESINSLMHIEYKSQLGDNENMYICVYFFKLLTSQHVGEKKRNSNTDFTADQGSFTQKDLTFY